MKSGSGTSSSRIVQKAITSKLKIRVPTHPEVGKGVRGTTVIPVTLPDGEIVIRGLSGTTERLFGSDGQQYRPTIIPCWYKDSPNFIFDGFYRCKFGRRERKPHVTGLFKKIKIINNGKA